MQSSKNARLDKFIVLIPQIVLLNVHIYCLNSDFRVIFLVVLFLQIDQITYMFFLIVCRLQVFRFAAIVGICILLPFNYMGYQLQIDFTDLPNKSVEPFSISNVDCGSNRFLLCYLVMLNDVSCKN